MLPKSGAVAADPAPNLNSIPEACRKPRQASLLCLGVIRLSLDEYGVLGDGSGGTGLVKSVEYKMATY